MSGSASNGIVVGLVHDLKDPEGLGRVRVQYPHLANEPSDWARIATPMAGGGRGFFFRPEVGDEVLVAFEHGDPRRPYLIGGLWSSVDKPPEDDGLPEKNNWRFIRSRSGHVLRFDDTDGSERIEIIDKEEKRRVVLDSSQKALHVVCEDGDVDVTAKQGTVKVDAQKIEIVASGDVSIKAQGSMTIEATGKLTLKGATVDIN